MGRIGGEAFGILCRTPSLEVATKHLETIRKKIAALKIKIDNGDIIQCTISIGVVRADESIQSLDALLHLADKFLYNAKGQGRNKTVFRV